MKKRVMLSLLAGTAFAVSPFVVSATQSVTGQIVGHQCAHHGKTCPVDKLDPHIVLETDFVLVKGQDQYYFLRNLPRDTKVRYALETVTVKGNIDDKYNSIDVRELYTSEDAGGKRVWSKEEQLKLLHSHTD